MSAESGTIRETPAALTFLGAAKTVTGSRFLIDTGTERLLVPGTRGRALVDGATQIKIHGHYVREAGARAPSVDF